jgi:hypothetical protein
MKKINPILILLSMLSIALGAKAQVNYTYDNNGNRIHRELYVGPPLGERSFSPSLARACSA